MKTLLAGLILLGATIASATPDPRDSIIIESKTVFSKAGPCQSAVLKVRVWITNKDTLGNVTLPFESKTLTGNAYATISRPANCSATRVSSTVFEFLYPPDASDCPPLGNRVPDFSRYHSNPPDSFMFTGTYDPIECSELPPTLTRTPLLNIKFDTVFSFPGQFELDSVTIPPNRTIEFITLQGKTVNVNFVKGTITVVNRGDLNMDGTLTAEDGVLLLNCTFLGIPPDGGVELCDVNCDGLSTPADVVLELLAIFFGQPFPC